jgi:hypothetical protein
LKAEICGLAGVLFMAAAVGFKSEMSEIPLSAEDVV